MVMKKNAMRRNLRQSIMKSFGRYIAIVAIIGLGAALFVGLLMTKQDMVATGQKFMDEQNMFDLRLMNSYGWTEEYLEKIAQMEEVVDAEGVTYLDLIARLGEAETDSVYCFITIPDTVNQVALRGGRMPESPDECLADGFYYDDDIIGQTVTISDSNDEDSLESVTEKTFTVVGYVATPLYMDMNRGTTTVGSGSLQSYFYVTEEALDLDYCAEINITIPGAYDIYTDEYNDALENVADALEPELQELADQRLVEVREEAIEAYSDGLKEYTDGLMEFTEGRQKADEELEEAYQELLDAEQTLADSEQQLIDGEEQIEEARLTLTESEKTLQNSKRTLASSKASAYKEKSNQIQEMMKVLQSTQNEDSSDVEVDVDALMSLLEDMMGLLVSQSVMDSEFAAADAQIESAEAQIAAAKLELDIQEQNIANGWEQLEEGKQELADGWKEYEEGKAEAEQELADARAELQDAAAQLADAWEMIEGMVENEIIILNRTSNVGYNNLESSSDIVQGVSRVIPVFFILVAALVCITTMTRMIDEERTQIGTLKALGYSNAAIISKYMLYAGTGAVIGCGLGVTVGNAIFPMILWQAYCIMLYIQPNIVLTVNWWLCIGVVAMYTAAMLLVTWYCCHRTLEEEPAELIRPKSPEAGKKILVEYLPFWPKISFLNKVTIRNIFRYRQRLAMMMVGIGGCTALLVTGFGLRDSIMNVVDYQFEEVSLYDMEVYFNDGLSEEQQKDFLREVSDGAENTMFFHQSSVDLTCNGKTKEIYMISAEEQLQEFMDLHKDDEPLSLPGRNEVVLSAGVAENLKIEVGDTVTLRNADLQSMELTVSGIYDNHVYNYSIVSPETVEAQWGTLPAKQMAFLQIREGEDVHALGAQISELSDVMNITISEDVAEMVGGMLEALDLVVMVIVFCAGLLAVIVLYNLTNININERIREIATIKVLGFNAGETAAYVFKENLSLTVAGSVFGLGLGYLMLLFVMSQIRIDMVWFKALVEPQSYLWASILTLFSAVVVDFIFYFRLDKINMAEALKSVE